MLKQHWPMLACALAIIATLIACTYWLVNTIDALDYSLYLSIRDLLKGR